MKNFSRFLPLSTLLVLLLSILIYSCQKTEVNPVKEQELVNQEPEFQNGPGFDDAKFIPLTEEEEEILNTQGIDVLWPMLNYGEGEYDYNTYNNGLKRFCNYKISTVRRHGGGGPAPGYMFCAVCPPKCKTTGIYWKTNGFKASSVLNQYSKNCSKCYGGPTIPRR